MQAIVFNGIKYYKHKDGYYQRSETAKRNRAGIERRLHRAVYAHFSGRPIPKGMHVHHKDGDKDNNDFSNLELLTHSEHSLLHGKTVKPVWDRPYMRAARRRGLKAAKAWHASADGRKWHSEHQKATAAKRGISETCTECGATFNTWLGKKHRTICIKCRQRAYARKVRQENPEKYKPRVRCILTCRGKRN